MKKTFVMAAAIMISMATLAQPGTKKTMKSKMKKDSMQTMSKDSLYMNSDTTSNGKYRMKKDKMKMKSKNKMPVDSSSSMN